MTYGKPNSTQRRLGRSALGLLALLGCAFAGAVQGEPARSSQSASSAQSPWRFEDDQLPERVGLVSLPGIVSLHPISLHELTQSLRVASSVSTNSVSEGTWTEHGNHFRARGPQQSFEVRRTLPDLWRLRLPNDGGSFHVSYEVTAANGRRGRLSHPRHPESEIRVVARPLLPQTIDTNSDTTVYEGGADLELHLDDALVAGEHTGTVTITLTWL